MSEWYEEAEPDRGTWWWAVEHEGHPAFYLRALCAGDFRPGRGGPLDRHVLSLDGDHDRGVVRCGTCHRPPRSEDLVAIERATGFEKALEVFRSGKQPWPKATDPESCWLCSDRNARAEHRRDVGKAKDAAVCRGCRDHLDRGGRY